MINVRIATGLAAVAVVATLSSCGSSSAPTGSLSTAPPTMAASPTTTRTSTSTSISPTPVPTPDADSIARILLAIPVARRPAFLDPYGGAIGGARLGLGPSLRIAGYRADPLFVCVQHVDMKAGTAGAWTAYAASAAGARSWGGRSGQCPPAPGRTQVLE